MENRRAHSSGLSSIAVTAVVSIVALLGALAWQISSLIDAKQEALQAVSSYPQTENSGVSQENSINSADDPSQENMSNVIDTKPYDPTDLSQMGDNAIRKLIETYSVLQQAGAYTPSAGERVADDVASSISAPVAYTPIFENSIKTDPDTSYKRMLQYRSDARTAFEPLLENTEAEFGIFAQYLETRDKSYLVRLAEVAQVYRKAAANAVGVVVPKDSVSYHVRIVNALLYFAATLEQLAKYADEPVASLALLGTYNNAELEVYNSFNDLAIFQRSKKL